jgi:aspartyl-tRNA(Asn)/glutamyl-tRNA(Gln) amidotransferase subunit B
MEKSQASEKLIVDLIKKVIASEKEAVASYKKGKKEAIGVLIGKVLREGQGLLNPKEVKDLLEKELS